MSPIASEPHAAFGVFKSLSPEGKKKAVIWGYLFSSLALETIKAGMSLKIFQFAMALFKSPPILPYRLECLFLIPMIGIFVMCDKANLRCKDKIEIIKTQIEQGIF